MFMLRIIQRSKIISISQSIYLDHEIVDDSSFPQQITNQNEFYTNTINSMSMNDYLKNKCACCSLPVPSISKTRVSQFPQGKVTKLRNF
jgi:hypothetical protein